MEFKVLLGNVIYLEVTLGIFWYNLITSKISKSETNDLIMEDCIFILILLTRIFDLS